MILQAVLNSFKLRHQFRRHIVQIDVFDLDVCQYRIHQSERRGDEAFMFCGVLHFLTTAMNVSFCVVTGVSDML